jgi:hypothetical protein
MRFNAFSILEMIVALFLSAIVISAVYSGYVFTNQQFYKFTSVKTEIRNYYQLSEVLHRDCEISKKVLKIGERKIAVEQIDQTIDYTFEDDFMVRTIHERADTFFLKVEGIEIKGVQLKNEFIVEQLHLNMSEERTFSLTKTYGAILQIEKEDGDRH